MKSKGGTKLRELQKRLNKDIDELCVKCGRKVPLTVDHIIPSAILMQMGLDDQAQNDEENFELICSYCNTFKGGKIDMLNPKTIPLLKKYIKMAETKFNSNQTTWI